MLLAYRLVKLMEAHSEGLARGLQAKVEKCDRCGGYRNVPQEELRRLISEVYGHLGEWLLGKTEDDIKWRYMGIGARRAAQGVPLSQVLWVISMVKENLWEYLQENEVLERPAEVFGELEVLALLDQFFDRAMYYAARGYENPQDAHTAEVLAGRVER